MPPLETIDGIKLYVYDELRGKHHEPHFHAYYAESEAEFYMDGSIKKGEMPPAQAKKIRKWLDGEGRAKAIKKWKELNTDED